MADFPSAQRRRLLLQVREEVRQVRQRVHRVRATTRALLEAERVRPLSPDEVHQRRVMIREVERLRLRMQELSQQFRQLCASPVL